MAWSLLNELGRRIIHITILVILGFFFTLKHTFGTNIALLALVALLLVLLVLEYARLELGIKIPLFQNFIRPKEQFKIYGGVLFLSSSIICLAVFATPVALTALLMTTFGDMVAAVAGKKYGTTILFKSKTAVGFGSELVTNLAIAVAASLFFAINIYIPIIMAFVATITETLVEELDDNLIVPLMTGFVGQILFMSI